MVFEFFLELIEQGSYFAIFISSFVISSTVLIPIIPVPSYLPILLGIGIGLNPFFVGLLSALGSSLGELISYFIGFGGSAAIEKFEHKTPKYLKWIERFYSNIGFFVVLIFSFLPFPFDIIGLMSGASQYDVKKFFLALLIGRTARSLIIAYTGIYVVDFVSGLFS